MAMTTLVTAGVLSPTGAYPREPYHRNTDSKDNHFIPINQNHNGCDESRRMDEDEIVKEEGDEDTEEEEVKTVASDDAADTALRVKNKRKNFQPRSIHLEEAGKFEKNRRKGAVTPQKCVMDLSRRESNGDTDSDGSEGSYKTASAVNLKTFRKVRSERGDEPTPGLLQLLASDRFNNPYGIDLSKFSRPHAGYGDGRLGLRKGSADPQPGEATAIKEYAEDTMRELLSIYGLTTTEMNEPITKNVDLSNFSAGKILEKCELGRGLGRPSQSPMSLSQPPTPPHTPLSLLQAKRRPDSPPEDSPEPEPDLYRHPLHSEHPARTLYTQGMLPPYHDSKDGDGQDSPPLFSTSMADPKQGSRLTSSPNREKSVANIDYSKYVRRFNSSIDCSSNYCKDLNYREHFHCLDCTSRVFVKKEEMIRHFKWHKKRDESLQHGFMRYSPMDDCGEKYKNCQHNRKQTHYHCVHESCDKTYISTSDVQMHANYHRKDSAIIQEGFQRFRATEECQTTYCAFYGQRTTHFHCRRDNCHYTFKNKADMEKHKSYHIKDEQLSRDGFKKFMKNEACGFENCRFSRISNHIHCIRANCSYVLHSSGQLLSHKRKHERKDSELAYRKFKLTQSVMKSLQDGVPLNLEQLDSSFEQSLSQASNGEYSSDGGPSSPPILPPGFHRFGMHGSFDALPPPHFLLQSSSGLAALQKLQLENIQKIQELEGSGKYTDPDKYQMTVDLMEKFPELMLKSPDLLHKLPEILQRLPPDQRHPSKSEDKNSSVMSSEGETGPMDLSNDMRAVEKPEIAEDDVWSKYLCPFPASEVCVDGASCEDAGKDHFHCMAQECRIVFRTKDAVREHGRNHAEQDRLSAIYFTTITETSCQFESDCELSTKHYHCSADGCREVVLPTDSPFLRLDHARQHESAKRFRDTPTGRVPTPNLASSLDAMFRRKRGRPPKNRIIEVWDDNGHANGPLGMVHDSPQAIFTSFKLPKPSLTASKVAVGPSGSSVVDLTSEAPTSPSVENSSFDSSLLQMEGFICPEPETCAEQGCRFSGHHLHCAHPRCVFFTDRSAVAALHKEFHDRVDILDQFVCFDRTADCRSHACLHNRMARHIHCMRSGCNFSFLRTSTMILHDGNHTKNGEGEIPLTKELEHEQQGDAENESRSTTSPSGSMSPSKNTVKAAGTFYPLSGLQAEENNKLAPKLSPRMQLSPENLSRRDEPIEMKVQPASPSKLFPPSGPNFILNPNFGDPRGLAVEPEEQNPLSKLMKLQSEATRNLRDFERQKRDREGESSARDSMPDYMTLEKHARYGPSENCSRPFCKLKRKEHFHCNACNQAFSDVDRLRHHIARHSSGAMSPGLKREPEDNNNDDSTEDSHGNPPLNHGLPSYDFEGANPFTHPFGGFSLPPGLNAAFAQQLNLMQGQGMLFQPSALYGTAGLAAGLMFGSHGLHPHHPLANGLHPAMLDMEQAQAMHHHLTNLSMAANPAKRAHSPQPAMADLSQEAKKARVQNSMRILKDEPVPDGYVRYRFNEDCKYPHCGYREHQTHFHCMRKDCGYSFCDKTRFVQHTARHERLDTLMGGDFQQYRANVSCSRPDCVYANSLGQVQNKASHFHCIKCDFVCTDTNKVVAHRRQHQKLDSINAAGFEKYTPSQVCGNEGCSHSGKQTHYHCLSCQYAVLGLSQMSAHKYRHLD